MRTAPATAVPSLVMQSSFDCSGPLASTALENPQKRINLTFNEQEYPLNDTHHGSVVDSESNDVKELLR